MSADTHRQINQSGRHQARTSSQFTFSFNYHGDEEMSSSTNQKKRHQGHFAVYFLTCIQLALVASVGWTNHFIGLRLHKLEDVDRMIEAWPNLNASSINSNDLRSYFINARTIDSTLWVGVNWTNLRAVTNTDFYTSKTTRSLIEAVHGRWKAYLELWPLDLTASTFCLLLDTVRNVWSKLSTGKNRLFIFTMLTFMGIIGWLRIAQIEIHFQLTSLVSELCHKLNLASAQQRKIVASLKSLVASANITANTTTGVVGPFTNNVTAPATNDAVVICAHPAGLLNLTSLIAFFLVLLEFTFLVDYLDTE